MDGSWWANLEWHGALAQLGERLHGMQEVSGSIPLGSTIRDFQWALARDAELADEVSSAGFFRVMAPAAAGRRGFVRRLFLRLAALVAVVE